VLRLPAPSGGRGGPSGGARPGGRLRPGQRVVRPLTGGRRRTSVLVARSIALFAVAAVLEIGGAWLVWQGLREQRGWLWVGAGAGALGLYGFAATFQPDAHFGRVLAAYGGVFVAGSILWGAVADG